MRMTVDEARGAVLRAARGMIGRTDVNFKSRSPAEGLVCIDVFVLACEAAGIPFRRLMSLLYTQNPGVFPQDGGPPTDVNFPRRLRNVVAFLNTLGLWHPGGPGLPGQLLALGDRPGEPAHSGVVGIMGPETAETVIMATGYGGPPAAVREVDFSGYRRAHPEFFVAGYADPPWRF